ncbi:hypothetical protein C7972_103346 [Arenibacter sp. ARW7G5Y1]|nr:hypothetical protein C7972_103346 [Arenibacter sp. ARW7G5Y1]
MEGFRYYGKKSFKQEAFFITLEVVQIIKNIF